MVDLGIGFADDRLPGADIVLPDLRFIEEQRSEARRPRPHPRARGPCRRRALSLAAARLPDLVPRLSPRPCCARKLAEADFAREVPVQHRRAGPGLRGRAVRLPLPPRHPLDPGLATRWSSRPRFGRVLHTGDWKLDPAPLVGDRTDIDGAGGVGPRGRAGDDRRQHQRALARHLGLRGRGARQPDRADRGAAEPGGAHHLRLQHRPARDRHAGRGRRRGASCSWSAARCGG